MRAFVCNNKTCVLETHHQNQTGSGRGNIFSEMTGGSVGLDPTESTFYIPLKDLASSGKKQSQEMAKRQNQTGEGRKRKRRSTKRRKAHSRSKSQRIRIKQFGAGRKKRKCVKRKKK